MRHAVKQIKGYFGRVMRDLQRQIGHHDMALTDRQCDRLEQAQRLYQQTKRSKNKLYSLHEPHVDGIAKGKAHKRYEFGVKASIATTGQRGVYSGC